MTNLLCYLNRKYNGNNNNNNNNSKGKCFGQVSGSELAKKEVKKRNETQTETIVKLTF